MAANPAYLNVFSVNTTLDPKEYTAVGNGYCNGNGIVCSLRAAIEEANTTDQSGNRITQIYIPAGHYLLDKQLVIKSGNVVFIDGAGADKTVLDGQNQTRVFDIAGGATVKIRGVMIQNGKAGKSDDSVAGTHYHGGGIHNHGTLILENSALSGNYSPGGVAPPQAPLCIGSCGGGLYNAGRAGLINVTVAYNSADAAGGGIANGGTLDLRNVTLADNLAPDSGGLYNNGSTTLFATIVANNDGLNSANNCGGNPTFNMGYNLQHSLSAPNPSSCEGAGIADPGLDPVKNANGAAIYYRIYAWSPAIDYAFYTGACAGIDQRGVDRPQDGNSDGVKRCDIGSYERRSKKDP